MTIKPIIKWHPESRYNSEKNSMNSVLMETTYWQILQPNSKFQIHAIVSINTIFVTSENFQT